MLDLAVIIVSWNTCDLTLQALHSLYADLSQSGLNAVVYVVDNASADNTVEAINAEFPQVRLIASTENLGFVGGNNYALKQIGFGSSTQATEHLPRAVYLLNSDTITQPGATRILFDALMADPTLGLVGARLTYSDGSHQDSAFMFPGLRQLWVEFYPTPGRFIEGTFNGRYPRERYTSDQPFLVDFTLGATMMLKREVIQQTGMFDDSLFMYCEEIDWAWRIHQAGWQVACVPSAHVVHLAGQSTSQIRARSIIRLWQSRLILFEKYYPRWKRWLAHRMIAAGMRRKIRQALTDQSLSTQDRDELIQAYRQVQDMTQ